MTRVSNIVQAILIVTVPLAIIGWVIWMQGRPVPHCEIINGHEIDTHHCIPYCPPDPKECD